MDQNTEFLNYIYQNSKMGADASKHVMKAAASKEVRDHLQFFINDYEEINTKARDMLNHTGNEEKDIGTIQKIMSYAAIEVKTMTDNSPCHIAEMMMQGNTMGIIDITKNLKKYETADTKITALGKKLLKLEKDGFEYWKTYLSMVE